MHSMSAEPANGAEQPRAPAQPQYYGLFVTEDEWGFLWRPRDEGVSLSAEGVSWRIGGVERARAWNEVEGVSLAESVFRRHGNTYICTIHFQGGPPLFVAGAAAGGHPEPERGSVYREFVQTLHARLARPEFSAVPLNAGGDESGAILMKFMLAIVALFLVGQLLVFIFSGQPLQVLLVSAVGGFFVWRLWRVTQKIDPIPYSPRDLPQELLP
jgi:hypothetical protein